MNSNNQGKSAKAATKALIEISQIDNSPFKSNSIPELERWVISKKPVESQCQLPQKPRPKSVYRRSKLEYFKRNTIRQKTCLYPAATEIPQRRLSIPAVSLLIPDCNTVKVITRLSSANKIKSRSNSLKEVNIEKQGKAKEKPIDMTQITKTLNMLIKREVFQSKINKENIVKNTIKPQVSVNYNLPKIITLSY